MSNQKLESTVQRKGTNEKILPERPRAQYEDLEGVPVFPRSGNAIGGKAREDNDTEQMWGCYDVH